MRLNPLDPPKRLRSHGRKGPVRPTSQYEAFLFFPPVLFEGLLRAQVLRSRNVRGGPSVDFALGGGKADRLCAAQPTDLELLH